MKFLSWNVNGWRAISRKGGIEFLLKSGADIIALQEIKVDNPEMPLVLQNEYEWRWRAAEKKGYSGTMLLVKKDFWEKTQFKFWDGLSAKNEEDKRLLNAEGRICAGEFICRGEKVLFINCYFPNGGMSEERLQYKMNYYGAFERAVAEKKKDYADIIICGDVNTAHEEIDLARPKENSKNTGFLLMERAWISEFLSRGFIDSWRYLHPEEKGGYSWWDYKTRARERNVGWRIDYFWLSASLAPYLKEANILSEVMGSDHAPIDIQLLA
ncbi:exodeoxyribonuclease III [Microgenomates group bacterium]|nr:exodeoxyribonuclease III [Microgenomates group bacterium]